MLRKRREGAMLLITVLIVGSVALLISMNLALRGIGELEMGISEHQSTETLSIADACMDEAFLRLARDSSYTGTTLPVGDGSCVIVVTGGSDKTIDITASIDRWTRRIQAEVQIAGGRVILQEWSLVR